MESRLPVAELKQAPDTIVIALACAGDDSAFGEVLRRRQGRVRKFMYHLCRQSSLGDDLAQQVFLTAWRSLRQLRSAAAFDGWLKRIMVTTWLEEVRRGKLLTTSEVELADLRAHHDATMQELDLDAALSALTPDMRLCVVLAYSEGLSHPEIVALTGFPSGTVKSHIARGAARMREVRNIQRRAAGLRFGLRVTALLVAVIASPWLIAGAARLNAALETSFTWTAGIPGVGVLAALALVAVLVASARSR
jgi:RNA polymerase sigma-70 factor (ECF subfamily)